MSVRAFLARAAALLALAACTAQSSNPASPSPPADLLVSLALAPDSIWLTQGDSIDLVPVGRTLAGDSARPAVTWQATGGLMHGDGRYVAGLDTGT